MGPCSPPTEVKEELKSTIEIHGPDVVECTNVNHIGVVQCDIMTFLRPQNLCDYAADCSAGW